MLNEKNVQNNSDFIKIFAKFGISTISIISIITFSFYDWVEFQILFFNLNFNLFNLSAKLDEYAWIAGLAGYSEQFAAAKTIVLIFSVLLIISLIIVVISTILSLFLKKSKIITTIKCVGLGLSAVVSAIFIIAIFYINTKLQAEIFNGLKIFPFLILAFSIFTIILEIILSSEKKFNRFINSPNSKIYIAQCGILAALYATLTISLSFIAYGPFQFRIAEALTIMSYFTPAGVYGLTIGCLISNIFSPYGLLDLVVGTSATLIASILTRLCSKFKLKYLAPIPPVVINMLFIGLLLMYYSGVYTFGSFAINALQVGLGQAVCCYGLGMPLLLFIEKSKLKNSLYLNN